MTTLELYRKHKKGEIGRDRFLYEVRRDNNLPWITNITSYDDAVKILKNKGIIRESVKTDPIVDNVNPYALKRAVHKILEKEKNLTNNSYVEALNKAAKKLKDSAAVKAEMFANAESVAKADAKLQTQEVKKANHKDKHNEMKKAKGQQAPKATSAPTKENKKTKKPKGVKVMPDKGVEGSQKIIKEISSYLKKKLTENSSYHDFHEGMEVETQHGLGIVKEINGGTLTVETKDGKLYDVQMNHVKHFADKKKEQSEAIDVSAIGGHEGGMKLANKLIDAIEMYNALDPDQKQAEIDRLKADIPAELRAKFEELMDALHDEGNYPSPTDDEMQGLEENVNEPLELGDRVKVTYGNQFYGMTGTIEDIKGGFVIVSIDDHDGEYSMHVSDVEKIEDDEDFEYEEELDEFTTAKTKDAAHNAEIMKKIDTTVSNPDAKKQLKQDFNAGKAIDL